jgi:hypothetical protein
MPWLVKRCHLLGRSFNVWLSSRGVHRSLWSTLVEFCGWWIAGIKPRRTQEDKPKDGRFCRNITEITR